MLVLNRCKGETITIGHDAEININGRQVSVGVKAPKDIPVYRNEVYKKLINSSQSMEVETNK